MMMNEILLAFIYFLHNIQPALFNIQNLIAFYI